MCQGILAVAGIQDGLLGKATCFRGRDYDEDVANTISHVCPKALNSTGCRLRFLDQHRKRTGSYSDYPNSPKCIKKTRVYPQGVGDETVVRGIASWMGCTVSSSGVGANCTLCERFDVWPPGFEILVNIHLVFEASAAFFEKASADSPLWGDTCR